MIYFYLFFAGGWLALLGCGLDITTAFSTIATTLSNVGPGLGDIGSNFKNSLKKHYGYVTLR